MLEQLKALFLGDPLDRVHEDLKKGSVAALKHFIEAGGNPNAVNAQHHVPLIIVLALKGLITEFDLLLSKGGRLDYIDPMSGGGSLLHMLADSTEEKNSHLVQRCLQYGLDPDGPSKAPSPPLYLACARGNRAVTKMLLDFGADPDGANWSGVTALEVLGQFRAGHSTGPGPNPPSCAQIGKILIDAGAALTGMALAEAASIDDVELVKVLLRAGLHPDEREPNGSTALMVASRRGNVETVRALIDAGANVNLLDNQGVSALTWSLEGSHKATSDLLAKFSAIPVGVPSRPERTTEREPLRYVAEREGKTPYAENLIHCTLAGINVRSKSEVIIADMLFQYNVKFYYERPYFDRNFDKNRLPDFTIELSSGTMLIWEHLGLMQDLKYRTAWERKREWYLANGVSQQNLYVTEDSARGGLDSRDVAKVAELIKARVLAGR